MRTNLTTVLVMVACVVLVAAGTMQAEVKAEMTAVKVVLSGSQEKYESAEQARPGEIIEYRVAYKNNDKRPVKNVVATLPVPNGTELQANTAKPGEITASLDGKTFAKLPLKRIATVQGKKQEVEVPLSEIRAIRWNLDQLAAGESKTVSARVKVAVAQSPAPNSPKSQK